MSESPTEWNIARVLIHLPSDPDVKKVFESAVFRGSVHIHRFLGYGTLAIRGCRKRGFPFDQGQLPGRGKDFHASGDFVNGPNQNEGDFRGQTWQDG